MRFFFYSPFISLNSWTTYLHHLLIGQSQSSQWMQISVLVDGVVNVVIGDDLQMTITPTVDKSIDSLPLPPSDINCWHQHRIRCIHQVIITAACFDTTYILLLLFCIYLFFCGAPDEDMMKNGTKTRIEIWHIHAYNTCYQYLPY